MAIQIKQADRAAKLGDADTDKRQQRIRRSQPDAMTPRDQRKINPGGEKLGMAAPAFPDGRPTAETMLSGGAGGFRDSPVGDIRVPLRFAGVASIQRGRTMIDPNVTTAIRRRFGAKARLRESPEELIHRHLIGHSGIKVSSTPGSATAVVSHANRGTTTVARARLRSKGFQVSGIHTDGKNFAFHATKGIPTYRFGEAAARLFPDALRSVSAATGIPSGLEKTEPFVPPVAATAGVAATQRGDFAAAIARFFDRKARYRAQLRAQMTPHDATKANLATARSLRKAAGLPEGCLKGGKGEGKSIEDFDHEQLAMGVDVEMEHTDNHDEALQIAMDHLTEDPEYYSKLKKAGLADELEGKKTEGVAEAEDVEAHKRHLAHVVDLAKHAPKEDRRRLTDIAGLLRDRIKRGMADQRKAAAYQRAKGGRPLAPHHGEGVQEERSSADTDGGDVTELALPSLPDETMLTHRVYVYRKKAAESKEGERQRSAGHHGVLRVRQNVAGADEAYEFPSVGAAQRFHKRASAHDDIEHISMTVGRLIRAKGAVAEDYDTGADEAAPAVMKLTFDHNLDQAERSVHDAWVHALNLSMPHDGVAVGLTRGPDANRMWYGEIAFPSVKHATMAQKAIQDATPPRKCLTGITVSTQKPVAAAAKEDAREGDGSLTERIGRSRRWSMMSRLNAKRRRQQPKSLRRIVKSQYSRLWTKRNRGRVKRYKQFYIDPPLVLKGGTQ